jgi:hypothetical protein
MKSTPRRRRPQASEPHQQAAASLAPDFNQDRVAAALGAAYAVRAGKTKHGPRNWGRLEYAQVAIAAIYQATLPKHVNKLQLTKHVNEVLARDPEYKATGYGELSRMTVVRALQTLRAANH